MKIEFIEFENDRKASITEHNVLLWIGEDVKFRVRLDAFNKIARKLGYVKKEGGP